MEESIQTDAVSLNFEESYRHMIETSSDVLMIISFDGKIQHFNQTLTRITGMTREKLQNSNFYEHFTEPDKARETYQKVFVKGAVLDAPLAVLNNENKPVKVLFSGTIYRDGRGNIVASLTPDKDSSLQTGSASEIKRQIAEGAEQKSQLALSINARFRAHCAAVL